MNCPACQTELAAAGFTHRCPACNGAWVSEDVVVGMLEERASALIALPWHPREGAARPCAACGQPMQTVDLGHVALDRCPSHGVWFDDRELAALLGEAKQFRAPEPKHASLIDVLKNVFKR